MSTIKVYPIHTRSWRKALEEMRRGGDRAYYPRYCSQEGRPGVYKGYALGTGKPSEAIYVRKSIGVVDRGVAKQMMLIGRVRQRHHRIENPFTPGDTAIRSMHGADIAVRIVEARGRTCIIAYDMLGKTHQQAISYTQLRPG